jgi:hypothetical protein
LTLLAVVAAGLVLTLGLAGALAVARSSAGGDRSEAEILRFAQFAVEHRERRAGATDRRASDRTWTLESPGRRREDAVRQELALLGTVIRDAQSLRLAEKPQAAGGKRRLAG